LWHRNRHIWAGIAFGFAIGCKWSAIYFVAVIGLIAVYRILVANDIRKTIKPIAAKFTQYGLLPLFVYTLTWTGWFISDRGWSRQWSNNPLTSWIHYHSEIFNFHTGLTDTHPYQANPWSWLIMGRPTSFFYDSPQGCAAKDCAQEVLALGTPILWWVGTIAIAVVVGYWIKSLILHRSDFAANIVVLGITAGYLPHSLLFLRNHYRALFDCCHRVLRQIIAGQRLKTSCFAIDCGGHICTNSPMFSIFSSVIYGTDHHLRRLAPSHVV
jgi:dolichyl-phosphate-mannose--protein O-mannosyl transferase